MSYLCICTRDVISEFNSMFLCSILCGLYLAFWDVVFVCVKNDVCEDVCCVYICWWLNVRESSLPVCV